MLGVGAAAPGVVVALVKMGLGEDQGGPAGRAADQAGKPALQIGRGTGTSGELGYEITYTNQSGGGDLARLEAALRQIQTKQARLQDAYLSGILELDAFASAKRSLDESEAAIRQELSGFHARTDEAAIRQTLRSSISAALATLRSAEATLEQKNTAARSIIETCTFDKATSTLSITYRVIF